MAVSRGWNELRGKFKMMVNCWRLLGQFYVFEGEGGADCRLRFGQE
jgi:hypothetical protein